MNETSSLWQQIAPSEFPWEREALDFVRAGLPDHEPFRAWANFEFVSEDATIHEVDLLVLSPKGLYLVEIKSWSGALEGDASTWEVHQDGRVHAHDSPLLLANRKARRLASLLKRQKALQKVRMPYLEPLVFLSNPALQCRLSGTARQGVHQRAGILDALKTFDPSELFRTGKTRLDRPIAKAVARALEEAGIRPTQRVKRTGDYLLDALLETGPDYQDWQAHHVSSDRICRRIRIYTVAQAASGSAARSRLERAARREIEALESVSHPGLLKPLHLTQHDLGPALVFEHDPKALRLDHFLKRESARLGFHERLGLVRQVAETLRYVHENRLYHRGLSPRSILVFEPDEPSPRLRLLNWKTAAHEAFTVGAGRPGLSGTSHLDSLVEEEARVYLAPEALTVADASPETLDVFSLGALAFYLFSGRPPAPSVLELHEQLRVGQGLQLAAAMDGVHPDLSMLIQLATHPVVGERWPTVADFLKELDKIERLLPRPGEEYVSDPLEARAGNRFREGFEIVNVLGKGSTSIVFLVTKGEEQHVLKLAVNSGSDDPIRTEAEILRRLKHPRIIPLQDTVTVCGRAGLLLPYAGEDGTIVQRLRKDGRFQAELLQRFGEDLLQAVSYLEREGVPHRDIKPDNLGLLRSGRNSELRLVLFDFSLSSTPADRIFAGTRPYLDPFLRDRKRWDLQAERYSAGVTLYEMATGALPRWGDGQTDPGMIPDEARIDPERMDSAVREPLALFFQQALRRDPGQRFDNAEEMLAAWRRAFQESGRPITSTTTDQPPPGQPHAERAELEAACNRAHLSTSVSLLGLSPRAVNALERADVFTVQGLLRLRPSEMKGMRGVGSKTRNELQEASDLLGRRLGRPEPDSAEPAPAPEYPLGLKLSIVRLDLLVKTLLPARAEGEQRILESLFGIEPETPATRFHWPNQSEVAAAVSLTRARVSQVLVRARERWLRSVSLTQVGDQIAASIRVQGGVALAEELAEMLLSSRGSAPEEPLRTAFAVAALRAATEVEETRESPRWKSRRSHDRILLALTETEGEALFDSIAALGRKADELAVQDPLLSSQRVLEEFQPLFRLLPFPLSADRLLSLAAGASRNAALSSRLELYPRDLPPDRAIRLASGSLLGARELTIEEIRNRVASRFPQALPLPGRPELDDLVEEVGLRWNPDAREGEGVFAMPPQALTTLSGSTTYPRSTVQPPAAAELAPVDVESRLFEERLSRSAREGTFLALVVDYRSLLRAEARLARRFPVELVSLEERWLEALRRLADHHQMAWDFVLQADARPHDDPVAVTLRRFAAEALKQVETDLRGSTRTVLLSRPGLLARYGRMELLESLRDRLARPSTPGKDGPHGLWVLVPMDGSATGPKIDGEAVPVITPALWTRVPGEWIHGGSHNETGKETA